MVKKLRQYVKSFSSNTGRSSTDRETDGQTDRRTDRQTERIAISVCWRVLMRLLTIKCRRAGTWRQTVESTCHVTSRDLSVHRLQQIAAIHNTQVTVNMAHSTMTSHGTLHHDVTDTLHHDVTWHTPPWRHMAHSTMTSHGTLHHDVTDTHTNWQHNTVCQHIDSVLWQVYSHVLLEFHSDVEYESTDILMKPQRWRWLPRLWQCHVQVDSKKTAARQLLFCLFAGLAEC